MNETVKVVLGILILGYFLFRGLSVYRLIRSRTSTPKITLGLLGGTAAVLLVYVIGLQLLVGGPWWINLISGLIGVAVAGVIMLLHRFYLRGR